MHQIQFQLGSTPDTTWELTALYKDMLAGLKGHYIYI